MARAAAKAVETQGGAARSRDAGARAVPAGREPAGGGVIAPGFWARERPGLAARALAAARRALWPGDGAAHGAARRARRRRRRLRRQFRRRRRRQDADRDRRGAACCKARASASRSSRAATAAAARAEPIEVDAAIHGARAVGDEPLLLARVAPCFVGADRVAAARVAIARGASALVLDDGLQNPSLAKDFTFAVIDGEARFGNGLCFPAGPLRAPPARQLPFVSAEVVVGGRGRGARRVARAGAGKADLSRRAGGRRDRRRRNSSAARCSPSPASRGRRSSSPRSKRSARASRCDAAFADHHAYDRARNRSADRRSVGARPDAGDDRKGLRAPGARAPQRDPRLACDPALRDARTDRGAVARSVGEAATALTTRSQERIRVLP